MAVAAVRAPLGIERTARQSWAEAQRDRVLWHIDRLTSMIEADRRFKAWLATPLGMASWVDGQGWPEPAEAVSR